MCCAAIMTLVMTHTDNAYHPQHDLKTSPPFPFGICWSHILSWASFDDSTKRNPISLKASLRGSSCGIAQHDVRRGTNGRMHLPKANAKSSLHCDAVAHDETPFAGNDEQHWKYHLWRRGKNKGKIQPLFFSDRSGWSNHSDGSGMPYFDLFQDAFTPPRCLLVAVSSLPTHQRWTDCLKRVPRIVPKNVMMGKYMFNKKLQQEVQVDQTLPLNDQPLRVDWTSRVQSMVYILKGARGDFVVCIILHQKKKTSPYRQKNSCFLILTHKFSRHALRLSETHGSDLKIALRCCFLKNPFGGAFYVIPGCGFFGGTGNQESGGNTACDDH